MPIVALDLNAATGLSCAPFTQALFGYNATNADAPAYGLLYAKDLSGGGGTGMCDQTGDHESVAWPLVEVDWIHSPVAGAGVTATLGTLVKGSDVHLTINNCVAYHYINAADVGTALAGITQYWPVFKPDGTRDEVSCS